MHTKASRNVDDFSVLVRSTKTEPHAAHRVDEGVRSSPIHLPSQAANIDVDDVRHGIEMQIPDVLQEQRARNDLTRVANEIRQELELLRQQLDLPPLAAHGAGEQVHLQVAHPQERLLHHGGAAAGQRIDASEQLGKGKGLDQIIVAACAQAADAIVDFSQGADDEGRRHDPVVAETPDDLDAVDAG